MKKYYICYPLVAVITGIGMFAFIILAEKWAYSLFEWLVTFSCLGVAILVNMCVVAMFSNKTMNIYTGEKVLKFFFICASGFIGALLGTCFQGMFFDIGMGLYLGVFVPLMLFAAMLPYAVRYIRTISKK